MTIYSQKVIVIRHPYITDILRGFVRNLAKALHDYSFSRFKERFVDSLLNNKTIILLNLVEYRLILANSAYGLVG